MSARTRDSHVFDVIIGWSLCLVVLAVTFAISDNVIAQLSTSGDEPWYLLLGYSILHNHTVDLAAVIHNHTVYSSFLGGVPDDHTGDPLRNGVRVLPNLPGYAALVGLFYAWQGRPAVVFMQSAFASLTATLLFFEARRIFHSRLVGVFAGLGVVCVAPALLYVGQLFPSTVAATFVVLGFVAVSRWIPEARGWHLAAAVAALAIAVLVLPWLHFRYMLASLALLALGTASLYVRYKSGGDRRQFLVCLSSVLALAGVNLGFIAWYCKHYFGTWTPPVNLTRGTTLGLLHPDIPRGLAIYYVTLLNPQAGLVPWAPVLLLAPIGLLILWRRDRWSAVCLVSLLIGLMATLAAAFWSDQVYQGYAFPGRFAIEAVPLLSLAAAAVLAWPVERIGHPANRLAATLTRLRSAPARVAGGAGFPRVLRRGVARWWDASLATKLGAAALTLACTILLACGAWFGVVASRNAYFLYYSPAGPRMAYRYSDLLPLWWFQAFPDTGEGFWNAPVNLSDIPLGNAASALHGTETVLSSDSLDLAPGRYVAHVTFTCASDSANVTGNGAVVAPVVERRVGSYPTQTRLVQIAGRTLHRIACAGPSRTETVAVPFSSNGYEQTVLQITYGAGVKLVDVTASVRHAGVG